MAHLIDFDMEHNFRFKDSVGKYVKVKTVDKKEHEGWLQCIDPMTGNLFLVTVDDDCSNMTGLDLLMGEACKDLEVLKEPDDKVKEFLENVSKTDEAASDLNHRKTLLLAWIKRNRLPCVEKEDGSVVVGDCATIFPPYELQNCASPNPRYLKSVRRLVAKMPSAEEMLEYYRQKREEREKERSIYY